MRQFPRLTRTWPYIPFVVLFIGLGVLWGRWPVVALDFDLWYHLTGGAYIAEHLHLPTEPFFSYLPAEKTWLDYYWLYQLLVHGLYSLAGYPALVAFRGLIFLASVACVLTYLRRACREHAPNALLPVLVLTCVYALALQPRDLILRPHAVTYLFVLFVHYVVNYRQKLAWLLPVCTVVWANIHGVEYPVLLLVFGAYLAEYFSLTLFFKARPNPLRPVRWPLIVSLYAILATPAGLDLLPKPFASPPFHELSVMELAPQPLLKFLGLQLALDGRLVEAAINALVVGAVVGAIGLALVRQLRLARLILLAGALVMLPMMVRFTFEFMVLVLPILGDALAVWVARRRRQWDVRLIAAASLVCVGLTLWSTNVYLGNRPFFPVDKSRLPEGVCNFLLEQGPGGRVYNVANPGGYLQWRLYPKYRIGMDMQTMLFATKDLYAANAAFTDKNVLDRIIGQYDPGFLLAQVGDKDCKKVIAEFPQFVQVYFDDVLVVYADAGKYPELVERFRLRVLDYADWQSTDFEKMDQDQRTKAAEECRRLLESYPGGLTANTIAAKLFLAGDSPAQADIQANVATRLYPDRFMGYALKGLAAFKNGRYEEALAWQRQALDRTMPSEREPVLRNIYASYVRLNQYDAAYNTLLEISNPMRPATPVKDLYDLALTAVASGRERQGRVLLTLARLKVPPTDAQMVQEIDAMAAMLPPGEN